MNKTKKHIIFRFESDIYNACIRGQKYNKSKSLPIHLSIHTIPKLNTKTTKQIHQNNTERKIDLCVLKRVSHAV